MNGNPLKKVDLHVHLLQSLYPEDVFYLAKDIYQDINWNRLRFLDRYEEIYGIKLSPIDIFARAIQNDSLEEIADIMTYNEKGSFSKFNIKSYFPLCVTGYYFDNYDWDPVLKCIVKRHKDEGISYIEYRQGVGYSDEVKEEWKEWHKSFARYLKEASDQTFQAKYIMRITDEAYDAVREFMVENPDLNDTVVGIDFTGRELSPKLHQDFFRRLHDDNQKYPNQALNAVVHIGEDFFDKSIESAIRWCHETAELGVKRLGHCIALGLAPEIAIKRQHQAHIKESVLERMNQIDYDLKYIRELKEIGIKINREKLLIEKELLKLQNANDLISREYDTERLSDIELRQNFVLEKLKEYGTVIEVCPTSNFRIGGIPEFKDHPFKKFYDFGVNLAICSDDPGVFNSSLSAEVDLIANQLGIGLDELVERIGDPFRFRLGQSRERI